MFGTILYLFVLFESYKKVYQYSIYKKIGSLLIETIILQLSATVMLLSICSCSLDVVILWSCCNRAVVML